VRTLGARDGDRAPSVWQFWTSGVAWYRGRETNGHCQKAPTSGNPGRPCSPYGRPDGHGGSDVRGARGCGHGGWPRDHPRPCFLVFHRWPEGRTRRQQPRPLSAQKVTFEFGLRNWLILIISTISIAAPPSVRFLLGADASLLGMPQLRRRGVVISGLIAMVRCRSHGGRPSKSERATGG